jgi:lipopolysaccharide/colanic/teichoic acid biosynthesis glycosyltransferase
MNEHKKRTTRGPESRKARRRGKPLAQNGVLGFQEAAVPSGVFLSVCSGGLCWGIRDSSPGIFLFRGDDPGDNTSVYWPASAGLKGADPGRPREPPILLLYVGDFIRSAAFAAIVPVIKIGRSTGRFGKQDNHDGDLGGYGKHTDLKASAWVRSRARRVFECSVAATALLALSPVIAACWLLVRCSSRGPVLFRQQRMGRNGRVFVLYKFRSMRCERSAGPSHTVQNDLRITRVGSLLRRFKLDELPQFWNVLKGDMSLVGPRPKLPRHESLHMPYRPGITGRATLVFRHEERMLLEIPTHEVEGFYETVVKPIKAELDIRYMEHSTFFKDVKMLARTIARCLKSSADGAQELSDVLNRHGTHALWPAATTCLPDLVRCAPAYVGQFRSDVDDAA